MIIRRKIWLKLSTIIKDSIEIWRGRVGCYWIDQIGILGERKTKGG